MRQVILYFLLTLATNAGAADAPKPITHADLMARIGRLETSLVRLESMLRELGKFQFTTQGKLMADRQAAMDAEKCHNECPEWSHDDKRANDAAEACHRTCRETKPWPVTFGGGC